MKKSKIQKKQKKFELLHKFINFLELEESGIDIIDGDRGNNYPHSNDFLSEGYCLFLNTKNIPGFNFDFTNKLFISEEKDRELRKGKLKRGDIVLTTRGTVGNIAYYNDKIPYENVRINSGMVILRNSNDKINTDYLYYVLRSNIIKEQFKTMSSGTAQPQLPIKDLKKILLPVPNKEVQKYIFKILSSLDDKIELNNKMNRTLEKIAQAIFKHWFVDFEFPDENGKPYKSSGGKMVDSEMGQIPKGWKVETIGNVLKTVLGGTPDKTNNKFWINGTIPWINSGKINEFRIIQPSEYITQEAFDNSATKMMPKGTTVIAITGATLGQISRLEMDMCANQSVIGIIENENIPSSYIYLFIKNEIKNIIKHQTGGAQQHINKKNVDDHYFLIPELKVLKIFNIIVGNIMQAISNNCFQNQTLSQLRDSLLPRLMAGKIKVCIK
jgi:type I restriction enzyme S subunit